MLLRAYSTIIIASGKLQIRRFQPPDFGCPALFQCNVGVYAVMIISRNTSCRPRCKSLKKFKTSRRSLQRSAVVASVSGFEQVFAGAAVVWWGVVRHCSVQ